MSSPKASPPSAEADAPPTPLDKIAAAVAGARAAFDAGTTRPLAWRVKQIRGVRAFVTQNEDAIVEAVRADLGRARTESVIGEVFATVPECDDAIANLASWAAERAADTPPSLMPATSAVQPQPLGVVCVIAPWNYPICLALTCLVAALAAGNACVLKPSEVAQRSAALMARLLPRYLDAEAVRLVLGGVPEATHLLKQRFDHIIYTGGTAVGRVVMRAAAEHLTPVTLELGGKSPALVDASADLAAAARSIVWGRCLNAGQTCVAPDYVLVDRRVEAALVAKLAETMRAFYGARAAESPDLGRIVSDGHFKRVRALLEGHGGEVALGGETDAATRFVAPTIVRNPRADSALMREEIFAPILPVIGVESVAQGVRQWVHAREKPLALYLYARDAALERWVMANTTSGGLVVNDCVLQLLNPNLPFGGVGDSGTGAYHGRRGFDAMSHLRAVVRQSRLINVADMLRTPPYSDAKLGWLRFLLTSLPGYLPLPGAKDVIILGLAVAVAVLASGVKR